MKVHAKTKPATRGGIEVNCACPPSCVHSVRKWQLFEVIQSIAVPQVVPAVSLRVLSS